MNLPGLELSEHKRSQSGPGGFIGGSFGLNNGLIGESPHSQNRVVDSFGSPGLASSSPPANRNFANVDRRGDDDGFDDDW